jgi:hypothetical protein
MRTNELAIQEYNRPKEQSATNPGFMKTRQLLSGAALLAALITFLALPALAGIAPTIVTNPVSQTLSVGQTLILTAAATGDAPLVSTLRRGTIAVGRVTNQQGICTFVIPNAGTNWAGTFYITVVNNYGFARSPYFYVTVLQTSLATNTYSLHLTGETNTTYTLEATSNLTTTNWQTVTNVTTSSTNASYRHTEPATNAARFFRILPPAQ